jgi:hypothetical protein
MPKWQHFEQEMHFLAFQNSSEGGIKIFDKTEYSAIITKISNQLKVPEVRPGANTAKWNDIEDFRAKRICAIQVLSMKVLYWPNKSKFRGIFTHEQSCD